MFNETVSKSALSQHRSEGTSPEAKIKWERYENPHSLEKLSSIDVNNIFRSKHGSPKICSINFGKSSGKNDTKKKQTSSTMWKFILNRKSSKSEHDQSISAYTGKGEEKG